MHFFSFRFHHPKAQTISNSNPEIIIKETNKSIGLQDVKCKLTFLSTPGEINHVLLAWPPKISVCDTVQGLSTQLAVGTLNIGPALVENLVSNCHNPLMALFSFSIAGVGRKFWLWETFLNLQGRQNPNPVIPTFEVIQFHQVSLNSSNLYFFC